MNVASLDKELNDRARSGVTDPSRRPAQAGDRLPLTACSDVKGEGAVGERYVFVHGDSPGADATVLSVIAPCYNEQDNIEPLVARTLAVFDELNIAAELLLVDDGSTDETWKAIIDYSKRDRRVRGVRHTSNEGIEGAWRSGLEAATGELVCLIDADLQNRPEDIAVLYKTYLREVPDVVQAVRHPVRGLRRCRTFSRALNLLLNLTFHMRLRDNKSGFILCRRGMLENILRHRYRYKYFQSFLGAAAGAQGCTIVEVDTDFDLRHSGKSFLSRFPIGVSARILWELLKFRVETCRYASRAEKRCPVTNARLRGWPITPALTQTTGGRA